MGQSSQKLTGAHGDEMQSTQGLIHSGKHRKYLEWVQRKGLLAPDATAEEMLHWRELNAEEGERWGDFVSRMFGKSLMIRVRDAAALSQPGRDHTCGTRKDDLQDADDKESDSQDTEGQMILE